MLIIYDTRTGSTRSFVKDCGFTNVKRISKDLIVEEPFVLVTYTTTLRIDGVKQNGLPPTSTMEFLKHNGEYLVGVAASGDRNWGKENFAKSADYICERYNNAKLICKFQKRGTERDRSVFIKGVELLDEGLSQIQQQYH